MKEINFCQSEYLKEREEIFTDNIIKHYVNLNKNSIKNKEKK